MNTTEQYFLEIPLNQNAHQCALKFAQEQATKHKGKQVYLNTLAVYAVNYFLEWAEWETNLDQSDSWNPGLRALFNVADLVIPDIGKLECRAVTEGETVIYLPPEVREERIAYIGVLLPEKLDKAKLLGFIPAADIDEEISEIPLESLQPIEQLSDYFFLLEERIPFFKGLIQGYLDSCEEDDPVMLKVAEILRETPLDKIVTKLESIHNNVPQDDWRDEGRKALAKSGSGGSTSQNRDKVLGDTPGGNIDSDVEAELSLLAEEWLEKLADFFGRNNG
ncbi:MAG: hypothetical protein RLZZ338_4131 [Cyanobacteriota bacterium]|jgi:hypothetical protein